MRPLLLLLLLAIVLVDLDRFAVEHVHSCTDEHRPSLYGFPLVHRTSVPWVNSMSGVRYVDGTVVNVLVVFALLLGARWVWVTAGWSSGSEWPGWLSWMIMLCMCIPLALDLFAIDWHWQWSSDWDGACFRRRWNLFLWRR